MPESEPTSLTDVTIVQIEIFDTSRVVIALSDGHSVLLPAAEVLRLALREGTGYAASAELDSELGDAE